MTREELIHLLTENFYDDFARTMAAKVVRENLVEELYLLAVSETPLPKAQKEKLLFRAAYTLEFIFFNERMLFKPYENRFFHDFINCTNSSAKRHFTKIMTHLLKESIPTNCEVIAEKCAEWAVDPTIRPAVKIGAVEVLFLLRGRVGWIDELLPEIIELLELKNRPSLECRIKRWRNVRLV